jgi:hypothetical protein
MELKFLAVAAAAAAAAFLVYKKTVVNKRLRVVRVCSHHLARRLLFPFPPVRGESAALSRSCTAAPRTPHDRDRLHPRGCETH